MKTSPAEQPKRTKAYKGMRDVAYTNIEDNAFIDDIMPVLNYWHQSKTNTTDSETMKVHKNNTFALLEILRKKYGNESS